MKGFGPSRRGRKVYDQWDVEAKVHDEHFTLVVGDLFTSTCDYLFEDINQMMEALVAVKKSARYREWEKAEDARRAPVHAAMEKQFQQTLA